MHESLRYEMSSCRFKSLKAVYALSDITSDCGKVIYATRLGAFCEPMFALPPSNSNIEMQYISVLKDGQ